jgi:hypothetical protein
MRAWLAAGTPTLKDVEPPLRVTSARRQREEVSASCPSHTGREWLGHYQSRCCSEMQGNGPWYFDFPSNGGVGYVYKPTGPLWAGQTITLRFAIQGDGTLSPADPADAPPTTVRLFIWRAGDNGTGAGQYEFYRWWSGVTQMPGAGEYTVQFPIDGRWTSIFAKSGDMVPGSFADALQNAGYVGFTMSGQYFAGHGVRANGPARFVLKEFSVN